MSAAQLLTRFRRRLGITGRTAVLAWMVSAATLLIFVAVIIPEQKQAFLDNLDSKAHGISVSVRELMAGAVNDDYSAVVDHSLELLKGDPSIDYVVITKNNGFSVIHQRSGWTTVKESPTAWRPSKRAASSGILSDAPYFKRRSFHSSQPYDYWGVEWGWIHVGLSLDSYDANVSSMTQRTAILAVFCMGVSFLASIIYARRLLEPLLNLRNALVKVASGDLTARAVVAGPDEVGSLALSFNQMADGLLHRDNILQSVTFVAEKFLMCSDWREPLPEILAKVGAAADASRLSVFQNDPGGTEYVTTSRTYLWAAAGVRQDINDPNFQNVSWHRAGFGVQAEALANGDLIICNTNDLSLQARAHLDPYQTISFVLAPIMVEGRWWGALALSDVRQKREWSPAAVSSLRAVADMLGAAIARQQAQDELRDAKEKAEAASQAKSQFLANMSHEIRTPITGVMGMLQLLKRTEMNAKQQRYATQALDSSETLLEVIGDVLDFSKIEAGRLELVENEFSLHELVDGAVHLFAGRADQKSIELVGRLDPTLPEEFVGDATRLRQILVNLLGNALKFTERGEIVLDCRPEEEGNGTLIRFEVRDTGCGIPPGYQERVFEAFSQADNSMARPHGGTGLGLAISRQLCELMGGKIGVESEPGKGASFWFTVRLKPVERQQENSIRRTRDLQGTSVLIVDDSVFMRVVIRELIQLWNGVAIEAADAESGYAQLQAAVRRGKPIGVAVLDWRLPGEDGLALAARIKADETLRHTGLVFLSSFSPAMDEEQLGLFAATISKPVRCPELYDAVSKAIQGGSRKSKASCQAIVPPLPAVAGAAGAPEILLAEDNEINREVVTELLTHLGYRWRCVSNGRQAVETVCTRDTALVLMDCQMPEVDGYQAARSIRSWEATNGYGRIPIIAITAHAMSGDREECLAAGMDDYVTKPIDPEIFSGKLSRWLGGRTPTGKSTSVNGGSVVPPVDHKTLLARCLGKPELAEKLVLKLAEQGRADESEIRIALGRKDAVRIARAAHRLKGAAANVVANPLRQLAWRIEIAARAEKLDDVAALLDQLDFDLQQLAMRARPYRPQPVAPT